MKKARHFTAIHGIVILSIFFIATICLNYCYRKSGFFVDELYSYGLANSQHMPFVSYIKGSICGQIYTRQDLYNYLAVSKSDAFDYASVYYNQTQDVHPPLFYFLLHTLSSVFQNSFSKWIGLSINLLFFVLTNTLLFIVAKKLFKSSKIALCGVILYSLNTMAISTLLMVRMYMMLTCLTVLLPYTLLKLNEKQTVFRYLFVCLTIFTGLLTQYFYIFYAFFLCGFYCLWLLRKKQYKRTVLFAISALCGVMLTYLAFPSCISHLFGDGVVSGTTVVGNLKNIAEYAQRVIHFSGAIILRSLSAVFVMIGAVILCLRNVSGLKAKYKEKVIDFEALIYIIPAFFTLVTVSVVAPYTVSRYVYNILPVFILLVCFFLNLAKHSITINKINSTAVTAGVLVVATVFSLIVQPEFLYTNYKEHNKQIEPFTDQPCVYITEEKNAIITSDLDQLSKFNTVYVSSKTDVKDYEEYIDRFDNYTHIVVYVSGDFREEDYNNVLLALCEKFELDSYEQLYQRAASTAYILSRK